MIARTSTDTGTFVHAAGLAALDAAQRFLARLLGIETGIHFLKVVGANLGQLLGHFLPRQLDALFVG